MGKHVDKSGKIDGIFEKETKTIFEMMDTRNFNFVTRSSNIGPL